MFNVLYQIVSTAVIVIGVILGIMYLCGIRLYHVKSGSMGELLPVGCVCFVSTYSSFDNIEVNDVISFCVSDDMLVTHRAIAVTEEGITTKGDENNNPDPDPVTKENYIGKTVFAVPYAGRMLGFFHSLSGKIVLATVSIVLLLSGVLYKHNDE
ncbi:MAG: signal peptidase I [Oscillospiraceae bacterium]|nr:signal peptidase I [Oscillospiraceae bacterium]